MYILKTLFRNTHFSPLTVCLFIGVIALTTGCDDSTGPENLQTGKITGYVQPIDQWLRPTGDKSGVKVSLKGTSYSDVTNAEGYFQIEGVERGTYTITYKKGGFGTNKLPFFDFGGAGTLIVENNYKLPFQNKYITFLGKSPAYSVRVDSVLPAPFGVVPLKILVSTTVPKGGAAMIVIFQGTTPDVTADPSDYTNWVVFGVPPGFNGLFANVAASLNRTVYYRVYPTAGFTTFADPNAKSPNIAWASLGKPSEVIPISLSENNNASTMFENEYKGRFVFLGINGKVVKEITIPKRASQKETERIYQKAHNYIQKYKKMWAD